MAVVTPRVTTVRRKEGARRQPNFTIFDASAPVRNLSLAGCDMRAFPNKTPWSRYTSTLSEKKADRFAARLKSAK